VLAGLAQHLDDRQAVDISGQHPIHDDHIVRLARAEKHAFAAVGRVVGRVPGFLQPLDHELADALVVLDQQDFHGVSPCGSARGCGKRRPARRRFSHRLNRSRYR
jgi:hypothetical protein